MTTDCVPHVAALSLFHVYLCDPAAERVSARASPARDPYHAPRQLRGEGLAHGAVPGWALDTQGGGAASRFIEGHTCEDTDTKMQSDTDEKGTITREKEHQAENMLLVTAEEII